MKQKTYSQTKEDAAINNSWHVIDATNIPLGRLATRAAALIRGKHKPTFTPHVNGGDHVVVINAEKVILKGKKLDDKKYYRHTGYVGGIKETTARQMRDTKPDVLIHNAVKGMIPRGALGHQIIKKLKVYTGEEHPHVAQNPKAVEIQLRNQ